MGAGYVRYEQSLIQGKREITHFIAQHVQKFAAVALDAVVVAVAVVAVQKVLCAQLSPKAVEKANSSELAVPVYLSVERV